MLFNIGDLVTRKSYNNDTIFEIIDVDSDIAILSGLNVRLTADANISDLQLCDSPIEELIDEDKSIFSRVSNSFNLDRDEYFYLPGKILHVDADKNYLDRCLKLYSDMNIISKGLLINEKKIYLTIRSELERFNPDVLVITGHDAFYDKDDDYKNMNNYKNSIFFVKAVNEARAYEKDHNKLIIIAGACQSNYEELIKSGANFASSPKRINIHALDPAIIATSICLANNSQPINLLNILNKTKYGKDGIGGIITPGVMYVGYPR